MKDDRAFDLLRPFFVFWCVIFSVGWLEPLQVLF